MYIRTQSEYKGSQNQEYRYLKQYIPAYCLLTIIVPLSLVATSLPFSRSVSSGLKFRIRVEEANTVLYLSGGLLNLVDHRNAGGLELQGEMDVWLCCSDSLSTCRSGDVSSCTGETVSGAPICSTTLGRIIQLSSGQPSSSYQEVYFLSLLECTTSCFLGLCKCWMRYITLPIF